YYGAMYGGSTTSILMRIPGEAASVMTCIDGYAMTQKGRAGPALAIAAIGSFIAGTVSVVGLMLLAPPIAAVALTFGPPEYAARHADRLPHRRGAGLGAHHLLVRVVRAGEEDLEAPRAIRPRRSGRRSGPRVGQQLGDLRRLHSAARPGHSVRGSASGNARRAHDSRHQPRAAAHAEPSRHFLGLHRQHVRRQRG